MVRRRFVSPILAVLAMTAVLAACSSSGSGGDSSATGYAALTGTLDGSGATFPKVFYEDSIAEFSDVATKLTVNYNAVGSGSGKKDLAAGTSDWAGSDSTVKDDEKGNFKGPFLYFPTVAAPITVSYRLTEVKELQLSPSTLARIFAGSITTWSDDAIAADNPGVDLPDTMITVVVRSDGSGTTSNFSKYLAAAGGTDFPLTPGDSVTWPRALAAKGNAGVAQAIKDTPGSIGYVDYSDAVATKLRTAAIRNKAGNYVKPSLDGATAALANATIKDDLTYSALNTAGDDSYPITASTYVIVYEQPLRNAAGVRGWLQYLLTTAQGFAHDADFAPLPDGLRERAIAQIAKVGAGSGQ